MKKKSWPKLILFIAAIEGIGFLSSLLSGNTKEKYSALTLPALAPPGWSFGIIWPLLFALMAIAAYLIYMEKDESSKNALFWFWVQLAVNFIWPIIFFTFGLYWAAFAVIIILDILVIYTIQLFRKINPKAAALMIPYLIWILFASYLNLGVAILN